MVKYSYGLDLGSNTIRGVVIDCPKDEFIYTHEAIVRTAEGLTKSGKVSDEATQKIILSILKAKEFLDTLPQHQLSIKAVTTEAIRVASNAKEVIQKIEDATGIKFNIIDGFLEAKYTMSAVRYRLNRVGIDSDRVVTVDIGGGSTEISIYNRGSFIAKSFKVGILTLSQSCSNLSEILDRLSQKSIEIEEFIDRYRDEIDRAVFTVTAGTPTTLMALKLGMDYETYDFNRINGELLTLKDIDDIHTLLSSMEYEQISRAVGRGREELIPVGVAILKEIYRLIGKDRAIVIDDGLREGVAISLCKNEL